MSFEVRESVFGSFGVCVAADLRTDKSFIPVYTVTLFFVSEAKTSSLQVIYMTQAMVAGKFQILIKASI